MSPDPADIILSILIPGLYGRMPGEYDYTHDYEDDHPVNSLLRQAEAKPVEVLTLYDNRMMTVGRKRSILLSIAQGRYCAFVDDDDEVSLDYVDTLLEAAQSGADVLCFRQRCTHADTGKIEHCRYGLGLAYATGPMEGKSNEFWWTGLPAHTMAWKTDLVQDIDFPGGNFGEDVGWVKLACKKAKTEHQIDRVLYFYNFDPNRSATRV